MKRYIIKTMNVGIIGSGITGLTAAYELTKLGHTVTIFEQSKTLGGLANGFRMPNWDWYIETYYHHLFTTDKSIINLLHELSLSDSILTYRPITATYVPNNLKSKTHIYPLDSAVSLLQFSPLPFIDRIKTGMLLGFMKINPWWQPLEKITAKQCIQTIGGMESWNQIWKPLFHSKFGPFADQVNAAWFWARIKKRTPKLIYIKGGFHTLVETLSQKITQQGGIIITGQKIQSIEKNNSSFKILNSKFDSVLVTIPSPIIPRLIPYLPKDYTKTFLSIPHLYAQILILETTKPILKDHYWLNISDPNFPFLAVVAHTNMISNVHYGGNHITYIGNYLPANHRYLSYSKEQLLKEFMPYLQKINQQCTYQSIKQSLLFIGPNAQPVHILGYSSIAPKMETSIKGLYIANMDSIFPWDRGTNYAVELGQKVAKKIIEKL
jgi:protoporphyrinogen oxidase